MPVASTRIVRMRDSRDDDALPDRHLFDRMGVVLVVRYRASSLVASEQDLDYLALPSRPVARGAVGDEKKFVEIERADKSDPLLIVLSLNSSVGPPEPLRCALSLKCRCLFTFPRVCSSSDSC